jgi:RimJ/RimL family protein N-acetyltransferase
MSVNMSVFLETERLILKKPELSDIAYLVALRSDFEVMQYTGEGEAQTEEQVKEYLNFAIAYKKKHGMGFCLVFEKETGKFVGEAGLFHLLFDDTQPEIEVDYHLHKKFWGKGYATELAKALVRWGFQHVATNKLVSATYPDNIASQKVLKKAGFDFKGKKQLSDGTELFWYEIYKNDSIELVASYDNQIAKRLTNYSAVSTELALLSDHSLLELLESATTIDTSTGCSTVSLEIAGTPVFVKKIRLTDTERQPKNIMSTANLYGLPPYCQYGLAGSIGSPGFGVWRELAANIMTTNWVLSGECRNFPLLYHWRILPKPKPKPPTSEQLNELDHNIEYWERSLAVRARLLENITASADIVLFLEHIPSNVHEWLRIQIAEGGNAAESACAMVEKNLRETTSFINSRGLLHFDAHFWNVLTDGHSLYFADFGLATSNRFELSDVELDFFKQHQNYDQCYTMAHLVKWILMELFGIENYSSVLSEYASGNGRPLAPTIEAIVMRYLPIAVVMHEFFQKLKESSITPYPTIELDRVNILSQQE